MTADVLNIAALGFQQWQQVTVKRRGMPTHTWFGAWLGLNTRCEVVTVIDEEDIDASIILVIDDVRRKRARVIDRHSKENMKQMGQSKVDLRLNRLLATQALTERLTFASIAPPSLRTLAETKSKGQ